MLFWAVNGLIIVLYGFYCKYAGKDRVFLAVSMIHLGVISAMRDVSVGTDTNYYAKAYEYLSSHDQLYRHAMSSSIVFVNYIKAGARLFNSPSGYMVLTTIPFIIMVYYFIRKYSRNYYMSLYLFVFFYFYFNSLNTARQYMAMAAILMVFYYTDHKRYIMALIYTVIAIGSHSAALPCAIICVFVCLIKWKPKWSLLLVVSIHLLQFLTPILFSVFLLLFPQYEWFRKYMYTASLMSRGRSSLVYLVYGVLTFAICIYWFSWKAGHIRIKIGGKSIDGRAIMDGDGLIHIQRMMIIVSVSTMLYLFYPTTIIFNRMASMMYLFMIVLLPNVIDYFDDRIRMGMWLVISPLLPFTVLQLTNGIAGATNYSLYGIR